MAGAVSRWLGAVEDLPNIAMRLMRVQIEHDLAANVTTRYDSEETLSIAILLIHTSREGILRRIVMV